MTDREKVIEILEKAKTIIEGWVPMFEQYNTPAGIDYAIALLKEQNAIEPLSPAWSSMYLCGKCKYPVGRHNNYCPQCGRMVKWDDACRG